MPLELTILGSGSALPTSEKYPTAHVLNVHGRFFLIDCGEGTQIQLRRQKIGFSRLNHVFISHLHGDHFYGLIGLISTRNLMGITSDLHIYAHSDIKALLQPQIDYLKGELVFQIIFHPLSFKGPRLIYTDKKAEVFSFPLRHSIATCGFLFREQKALPNIKKEMVTGLKIPIRDIQAIKQGGGFTDQNGNYHTHEELTIPPPVPRSYAFCTDTVPYDPAIGVIANVNLLYHEATFQSDMEEWAAKTFHSTAKQAAEFACKANAGRLIIGHFSNRYGDDESFLTEARQVFQETYVAAEGLKFTI